MFEKKFLDSKNNITSKKYLEYWKEAKKTFSVDFKNSKFASSSSAYERNIKSSSSEKDKLDKPLQLHTVTKVSDEVIAYSYSRLFGMPITALSFFTFYGPWRMLKMALHTLTKKIIENKKNNIFNNGESFRDFTYISDVIDAISNIIKKDLYWNQKNPNKTSFRVFNLENNNKLINILNFIKIIKKKLKKKSILIFFPTEKASMTITSENILKA